MLTERIRQFRSALVAFAPVRLSVLNAKKTSADFRGSLFAIIDRRLPKKQIEKLCDIGISPIFLEADERLPSPMASHADMLIFRHEKTLICSEQYFEQHPETKTAIFSASQYDIRLCDIQLADKYPYDASFNAKVIGNSLFCKSDTVSKEIIKYAEEANLKIISVKQGYPACTVFAVNGSFAVTSDMGMKKAMENEGIDVFFVPECEKILLPPYKNGFIGGCTAIYKNLIFFFGNANVLAYFDNLSKKLFELGYEIISLDEDSDSLLDLGGALFLEK